MKRSSVLLSRKFSMKDVYYQLPESLIGIRPAARGESKLLHYTSTSNAESIRVEHRRFKDIVDLIPRDSVMIFNSSKVFNARLWGVGEAANPIEIMMLSSKHPSSDPGECYRQALNGQVWNVVIRGDCVTKIDEGDTFLCKASPQAGVSSMIYVKVKRLNSVWEEHGELPGFEVSVEFMSDNKKETLANALEYVGTVPIPPYLNRSTVTQDSSDYQTVYADDERTGSVAAPTAGLHFDDAILSALKAKGVTLCDSLSLHVGAGTFKPVVSECISGHEMHVERFSASRKDLAAIVAACETSFAPGRSKPLVCVGTTSVRLVESLYWCGVKNLLSAHANRGSSHGGSDPLEGPTPFSLDLDLDLGQWEPQDIEARWRESGGAQGRALPLPSLEESYSFLLAASSTQGNGERLEGVISGSTALCITPGYQFRATDKLITNFHQAESTLMLLVSAFLARQPEEGQGSVDGVARLRELYATAVEEKYRFLSYGDSMFLDV